MNLVVTGAAVEQPVLLPSPARYPGQLFKLNLGNITSLEMEIRAFVAMHYAARISWQRYSDQSQLVRAGPSYESECLSIVRDRLLNRGDLRITDLALQWLASEQRCFPVKHGGPAKLVLAGPFR